MPTGRLLLVFSLFSTAFVALTGGCMPVGATVQPSTPTGDNSTPSFAPVTPELEGTIGLATPTAHPAVTQEAPAMNTPTSRSRGDKAENIFVEQAREDLADRLDVSPERIELVEFKAVIWPDSSLGCPQPGMAYTQVQRDGYLAWLRFEGKLFAYHGGGSHPPFLCEKTAGDDGLQPPQGLGDE